MFGKNKHIKYFIWIQGTLCVPKHADVDANFNTTRIRDISHVYSLKATSLRVGGALRVNLVRFIQYRLA